MQWFIRSRISAVLLNTHVDTVIFRAANCNVNTAQVHVRVFHKQLGLVSVNRLSSHNTAHSFNLRLQRLVASRCGHISKIQWAKSFLLIVNSSRCVKHSSHRRYLQFFFSLSLSLRCIEIKIPEQGLMLEMTTVQFVLRFYLK